MTDLIPTTNKVPWYDRFLSRNTKALVALGGALLTWGGVVVASRSTAITATEWLQLGGGIGSVFGVYAVTNKT